MVLIRVMGLALLGMLLLSGCQNSGYTSKSDERAQPPRSAPLPSSTSRSASPYSQARPGASSPAVFGLYQRGRGYAQVGAWLSVIDVAEQGLRIDRRYSGFYLLLAQAHEALGNRQQALRFAEQAARLCTTDCRASHLQLRRLSPMGY